MAQGNMKQKLSVPGRQKKKAAKKLGLKKGPRIIPPKRTKRIEEAKLKKSLEKLINENLHNELTTRASSIEPKSFHVLKSATQTGESSKNSNKARK